MGGLMSVGGVSKEFESMMKAVQDKVAAGGTSGHIYKTKDGNYTFSDTKIEGVRISAKEIQKKESYVALRAGGDKLSTSIPSKFTENLKTLQKAENSFIGKAHTFMDKANSLFTKVLGSENKTSKVE